MKKVYLAGAIELIGLEQAQAWRRTAAQYMDAFTDLEAINPIDFEDLDHLYDERVVNTDKALIMRADALLVDGRQPGWGTAMEVHLAYEMRMPIVVWGIEREKATIWLRYHATAFDVALNDAVMTLAELA